MQENEKQKQLGPTENTNSVIKAIINALREDEIDNPRPTCENWYVGFSDSPQIRNGKRRFYYYKLEDKVQTMIVFSALRELEMVEEKYHISIDSKIKYIMLYHN